MFFLLHHTVIHEQWGLKYSDYLILLDIEKENPGHNKYHFFLALIFDFIVLNDVQCINLTVSCFLNHYVMDN